LSCEFVMALKTLSSGTSFFGFVLIPPKTTYFDED